jgi:hypothetical protein
MKYGLLICLIFVSLFPQPIRAQQTSGPLAKDQVMDLVRAGMETPALVKLIREHGIDFDLTNDYLQTLRKAGAEEPVIRALQTTRPQPLSKDQLLKMVAAGVPSTATRVKQRGVNFVVSEEYLRTLRLAGADDDLVSAVRKASAEVAVQLVVRTSAGADVYLDNELLGHADTQGSLNAESAAGTHSLKVTLTGKQDFQQSITLAAHHIANVDARLEDIAPPAAPAGPAYTYTLPSGTSLPLATEATTKVRDCMSMVNIWNSKLQQVMSGGNYSQLRAQMAVINQERVETYRSKYLPGLRDLQQKLLQELDRTSGEHLDYEMVQTPLQMIGVCNDVSMLASDYRMNALQGKLRKPGAPPANPGPSAPVARENPGEGPAPPRPQRNDARLVAATNRVATRQPVAPVTTNPVTAAPVTTTVDAPGTPEGGIVALKSATGRLEDLPQIWRNVVTNDLYRIRFDSEHIIIYKLRPNQIVADLTLKKGKYVGTTSLSPCQGGGHMEVPSWSATRIEAKIEVPDAGKVCGGFSGFGHAIGRSMVDASFVPESSGR